MEWIISTLSTIGIFIGALFILVLVHELGHFLFAKAFKMRVERFSIGFPPRVFGKQIGDTDYCISATPLGGYVKIAGMVDESMDTASLLEEPKPWEYRSKPVWQKMIVIVAGVVFNMILAVLIYTTIFMMYGDARIPVENIKGLYVAESGLPAEVGFKTGDQLLGINGKKVRYFDEIFTPSELTQANIRFLIKRNGQEMTLTVPGNFIDRLNKEKSFIELTQTLPSIIGQVSPGAPAEKAGLVSGDTIVAVDGIPIQYWAELSNKIKTSDGQMAMTVRRNGADTLLYVTPNPESKTIGIGTVDAASYFGAEFSTYGLFTSIAKASMQTWDTTVGILNGFGRMFSGDISVRDNLGGPIAIASFTKEAAENGGWLGFWNITALLSITLAIMNLLPIPVLDGGHLMFLIYEAITRREPSLKVRMVLQQIGFVLIIGLMVFVTFNDIAKVLGF